MVNARQLVKKFAFVPIKHATSRREIQRYMAATPTPKLNVGAGGNRIPGWLDVDFYPAPGVTFLNASKRWPFANATFDAILCEHMIEHIPKTAATFMIGEMRRTLKPGGWIRVVTPDLTWFANRILDPSASKLEDSYLTFIGNVFQREQVSWCDAINLNFYEHGHQYIWSVDELVRTIGSSGFADVTITRAAYPQQQVFAGAEGHPKLVGAELDAVEAFAIEARVPVAAAG
jgi:SAM-dependent methyltransferase